MRIQQQTKLGDWRDLVDNGDNKLRVVCRHTYEGDHSVVLELDAFDKWGNPCLWRVSLTGNERRIIRDMGD
jgi:hypothetical protein